MQKFGTTKYELKSVYNLWKLIAGKTQISRQENLDHQQGFECFNSIDEYIGNIYMNKYT